MVGLDLSHTYRSSPRIPVVLPHPPPHLTQGTYSQWIPSFLVSVGVEALSVQMQTQLKNIGDQNHCHWAEKEMSKGKWGLAINPHLFIIFFLQLPIHQCSICSPSNITNWSVPFFPPPALQEVPAGVSAYRLCCGVKEAGRWKERELNVRIGSVAGVEEGQKHEDNISIVRIWAQNTILFLSSDDPSWSTAGEGRRNGVGVACCFHIRVLN